MTLKPGIYKATVRGVPAQVVMIHEDGTAVCAVGRIEGWFAHTIADIADPRPLIVLDPIDGIDYPTALRNVADRGYACRMLNNLANQIEDQIPPRRIDEPGLYGVVESDGHKWTHLLSMRSFDDWLSDDGTRAQWGVLPSPVLIREGLEP